MEITFREFKTQDIPQVMTFFQELREEAAGVSFTEYDSKEKIEHWLEDENTFVYVALQEEVVLGVLKAARGEEAQKAHAVFLTAAVNQKARGKKVAKRLTEYALEQLKKEEVKIARAYVYSDNSPSIQTILSCGFQFSGNVHMHHFDFQQERYVDDLIFHKIL